MSSPVKSASSLKQHSKAPTACITDNKAACDVIKYPGATKRTLHFDGWLHFAREMCLHNRIEIFLTGTDNIDG